MATGEQGGSGEGEKGHRLMNPKWLRAIASAQYTPSMCGFFCSGRSSGRLRLTQALPMLVLTGMFLTNSTLKHHSEKTSGPALPTSTGLACQWF